MVRHMDTIEKRRSIRKYKDIPVPKTLIQDIVRAGTLAPSAKNRQPWKYIVYTGNAKEELLEKMEKGLERERDSEAILPNSAYGLPDAFNTLRIMREAPVIIIVLNTNGSSPYNHIKTDERISEICDNLSIGASIENIILRANELGLGTLWVANTCFAYPELVEYIGTANQLTGAICVGYPDEAPLSRPRKPLEDVLEFRE